MTNERRILSGNGGTKMKISFTEKQIKDSKLTFVTEGRQYDATLNSDIVETIDDFGNPLYLYLQYEGKLFNIDTP